jgi:hypothetical protein
MPALSTITKSFTSSERSMRQSVLRRLSMASLQRSFSRSVAK